ncbi:protein TBATA isoform 1-T2 [Molossus nigricans]
MAEEVRTQLAEHALLSPRSLRGELSTEQEIQGPGQQNPQRVLKQNTLLNVHLCHRGTPSSQGHQEKGKQTASSPRAEPKAERHRPGSHGVDGPQKELMVPGTVDFKVTREELRTPKSQNPSTYRFGRLSHHSFFSRHHPHPQHVTHIQDLSGKSICVVKDEFSRVLLPQTALLSRYLMGVPTAAVPIGDPQSNRDPRLSSETWKKELKDLASQLVISPRENELKNKEEEPQREQGAKYSAETGRLIPASARALGRRCSHQGRGNYSSGRDEGPQTFVLQDQELLGGLALPGSRFSGSLGRVHRAGHPLLHLPSRARTAANRSHSRHQHPGLGSPQNPFETELGLFSMILAWRTQRGRGPGAAEATEAEDTAASKAGALRGGKEPQAQRLAEPASPGPQRAHWHHPASLLTSPGSEFGNFRVGRLLGSLQSPHQGLRHLGFDLGAALPNPADRFPECYPVLASLRSSQGERLGTGAPADGDGSAPSPGPRLHLHRKASEPAPGSSRTTAREATTTLQPIPEEVKDTTSTKERKARAHWESTSSPGALKPELGREGVGAKDRVLKSLRFSAPPALEPVRISSLFLPPPPEQQYVLFYHIEPIKIPPSL